MGNIDRQHQRGSIEWLDAIMQRLLSPEGCPWDREQTLQSLKRYLVEETYEVLDAIDAGQRDAHCEELGDLLYQIVFQAELAEIPLAEVICSIGDKLIRRHPHVFGDVRVTGTDEVLANWELIKAQENGNKKRSIASGIPRSLPALVRGTQLYERATRVGLSEEIIGDVDDALRQAVGRLSQLSTGSIETTEPAIGEILTALVRFAASKGIDLESVLRQQNAAFEAQVRAVEEELGQEGISPHDADQQALRRAWRSNTSQSP